MLISLHFYAQLVPAILKSLDGKPEPQQDALLLMILPVLGEVTPPSEDPAVQQVRLLLYIIQVVKFSVFLP
jgi:hypothetical protein